MEGIVFVFVVACVGWFVNMCFISNEGNTASKGFHTATTIANMVFLLVIFISGVSIIMHVNTPDIQTSEEVVEEIGLE